MDEWNKIRETAAFLKKRGIERPEIGIILGTGLGSLAHSIRETASLKFEECPYFPRATAIGHAGRLVYGTLQGKRVVAMEGRFHHYEGYSLKEVTYPVRVMKALGVRSLVLSNAAGGLNPGFRLGEVMVITDHINFIGDSPLAGPNDERLGPRFPDMSGPYDRKLAELAEKTALDLKIGIRKGVYAGVKGPNLETAAEYRFLKAAGADAVGMSTVPEAIVAAHAGLKTLAFSVITDLCLPDALKPVNIEEILRTAAKAEPVLTRLVAGVIKRL